MYLVSFRRNGEEAYRVGAFLGSDPGADGPDQLPGEGGGWHVLDLARYGAARGLVLGGSLRQILAGALLKEVKAFAAEFRQRYRKAPARCRRYLLAARDIRLGPPIPDPPKILLVGKNYREHCQEGSAAVPAAPVIFSKFRTCLVGPGERIVLPRASLKVDYEAELAVVIGRGGRHIPEARALGHVAGYMALNDVSARDLQAADGQWIRAKGCDTFCPCGPALATADEVGDPQRLGIRLVLNGAVMQDATTAQMIFSVARLISFISEVITLEPGDIIATGTPSGVGAFRDPPVFLNPGDRVSVAVERVGTLRNPVAAERGRASPAAPARPEKAFS